VSGVTTSAAKVTPRDCPPPPPPNVCVVGMPAIDPTVDALSSSSTGFGLLPPFAG
jgi:hypothetical protein